MVLVGADGDFHINGNFFFVVVVVIGAKKKRNQIGKRSCVNKFACL